MAVCDPGDPVALATARLRPRDDPRLHRSYRQHRQQGDTQSFARHRPQLEVLFLPADICSLRHEVCTVNSIASVELE